MDHNSLINQLYGVEMNQNLIALYRPDYAWLAKECARLRKEVREARLKGIHGVEARTLIKAQVSLLGYKELLDAVDELTRGPTPVAATCEMKGRAPSLAIVDKHYVPQVRKICSELLQPGDVIATHGKTIKTVLDTVYDGSSGVTKVRHAGGWIDYRAGEIVSVLINKG